jgi:hypothetical protein
LKAVRSRKSSDLNAEILEGHQSAALCHVGNISYRLGQPVSPARIEERLQSLPNSESALEAFERTRKHLGENGVDPQESRLTLGALLRMNSTQEMFIENPDANALLVREYRKPFALPSAKAV